MIGLEWIYTNSTKQYIVLINKRDIKKQGLGDRVDMMGQLQIIVSSTKTERILRCYIKDLGFSLHIYTFFVPNTVNDWPACSLTIVSASQSEVTGSIIISGVACNIFY